MTSTMITMPVEYEKQSSDLVSTENVLVSVVIPNYNHTTFISDAIQSVMKQTYRYFEIIVVDDGSTDNSREVVTSFGDQVRYIWQENQGLAGARNTGVRAAKGELVGLLDADDQWQPDFLAEMVSLATQHPEAAVYYCSARGMDVVGCDLPQVFGGPARPPDTIYPTLLRANFLIPSTILLRRSVVITAGLFDQTLKYCEDWDLWLRIAPKYAFVGTSTPLVRYRLHSNSLSNNAARTQQTKRTVIEKYFGPDDEQWKTWSSEKQRAYGGVYRFHALTSIQRQNDWQAGSLYLRRSLQIDPTLAGDLDLFYDLALNTQPSGYRGTSYQLDIKDSAEQIERMLTKIFLAPIGTDLESLRRNTYGTAYYALGLVAYHTGRFAMSRRFIIRAFYYRPNLVRNAQVWANFFKSFAGVIVLSKMKKLRLRLMQRKIDA